MSSAEINDVRINTNPPKPKIRWIGVDPDQVAVMRQYFAFGNDTEALEFLRKGDQRILLPVHDMTYGEYWLQRVEEGTPANQAYRTDEPPADAPAEQIHLADANELTGVRVVG